MEFDKDGNVILETINQKIVHENLDDIPPINKCIYIPIKDDLIKFVYEYLKKQLPKETYGYCSKKFLAGICIEKFHPLKPNNQENIQRSFKRKISQFFLVLKKLGLASPFNTTTIRIHKELNDYTLDDVYKLYNENLKI